VNPDVDNSETFVGKMCSDYDYNIVNYLLFNLLELRLQLLLRGTELLDRLLQLAQTRHPKQGEMSTHC
jgi:hypothetical protein